MWWKKTVSKAEMGRALWQVCVSSAEDFYSALKPKLHAKGFLHDPASERVFMEECILVHFWIIWFVLNKDRAILDELNNIFNGWDITQNQARVSQRLQERFHLYFEATEKDKELHARGLMPLAFSEAALRCLLNDGRPIEGELGVSLMVEVNARLSSMFPSLRKFRDEFNIRGA